MARVIVGIIMSLWLSGISHAQDMTPGNGVGNGADAIRVGGALKIFDSVEFDQDFVPSQLPEVWAKLDGQLTLVERKLPKTGAYLRRILTGGYPIWWFVNVRLKDIPDEGATNIYVTYAHQQIAANKDGMVQIDKELFAQLELDDQVSLFAHEALWIAVGPSYIGKGDNIRKLARLLMSPNLAHYPASTLGGYITQFVGSDASPLSILAALDVQELAVRPKLDVREVVTELGPQPVVTVVAPSRLKGLMVSGYKANPRYAKTVYVSAGSKEAGCGINPGAPYTRCSYFANDTGASLSPQLEQVLPQEICGGVKYAGHRDWRLARYDEIFELDRLGLFSLRFPQTLTYRYRDDPPERQQDFVPWRVKDISRAASPLLYPPRHDGQHRGDKTRATWLITATEYGRLVPLSTFLQHGPTASMIDDHARIWDYAEYLCVRP